MATTRKRKLRAASAEKATAPAKPQPAEAGLVDYDLLPGLVGYALRKTQLSVFQHFARAMAAADELPRVSPGEFGVLALIAANAGISQTRLAQAVGADRSTMVPILDRLERRGLIERQKVPGDRRTHALTLGPVGRARFAEYRAVILDHERRIADGLSTAERALLIQLLQRLRKAADQA